MNPEPVDPGLAPEFDPGARPVDPRLEGLASYRGEIVEATAREVASHRPSARTAGSGRVIGDRAGVGDPGIRADGRAPLRDGVGSSVDDEGDLAAVYRRLYPSLVRTAYLLVDTREQAEEVVQEAFAKAFPRWDRLRIPEAYVRTCVVNGCRKVQRRRGLARRLVMPPLDEALGEHDHIADAVRRLPSPQREAVVLRYYLQATDAEIAATLKVPVGTVKSSLHRARAALREQFVTNDEEDVR